MQTVNVHQAKTNLSHYLGLVQQGHSVVISKRNIPIAQLTPIQNTSAKRQIGQSQHDFTIPTSFFDPLPQDIINSFTNPK